MSNFIRIDDVSYNLDQVTYIRWVWSDSERHDTGLPVKEAYLLFGKDRVHVRDHKIAHAIWLWCCEHSL
jgi:hypothetical protein